MLSSLKNKITDRIKMEGIIKQSLISLQEYTNPEIVKVDAQIPESILKNGKGIVIFTAIKTGFIISGQAGTGIVLVKNGETWSPPSAISVSGLSIGFTVGAAKVENIIVLNTDEAVKQFSGKSQLRLGVDCSLAIGLLGRDADASVGVTSNLDEVVSMYSYSKSKGLYGGVSVNGKIITIRHDCNSKFYGQPTTIMDIFTNQVIVPANNDLTSIYDILGRYC